MMSEYVKQAPKHFRVIMSTVPAPSALPRIRILVCGDSGVGKSSLVSRICGLDSSLSNSYITPNWLTDSAARNSTGVCMTSQVYYHDSGKSYFCLEFLDFNGSRYFEPAREVLLSNLQGIIFVYDVSNRNSYENLQEWIQLVCQTQKQRSVMAPPDIESLQASRFFRSSELVLSWFSSVSHSIRRLFDTALPESQPSQSVQTSVKQLSELPVLTVGNKTDVLTDYENASLPISFDSVSDFGIPGIFSVRSCMLIKMSGDQIL
jgi:energy-coupling factor transporter ATP-binding protein EcfA2